MELRIDKTKKVRINASSVLSIEDVNVINLLYGPILKERATHLYLSLYSLLNRVNLECTFILQELLDILGIEDGTFNNERRTLEALNLLQTHKGEEDYLLLLKAPLSAKSFLTDGILGMYLYTIVGETSFKAIQSLFAIPKIDKTKYQEISANFDDVFVSQVDSSINPTTYIVDKRVNDGIKIKNEKFDFELFKNSISEAFLSGRRISKKFEQFIISIAYAYNFNEEEMKNIYNKSLNSSGYFDYQLCSKVARSYYKKLHDDTMPELAKKEEQEKQELSIEEVLRQENGPVLIEGFAGRKASPKETEDIEKLYLNFANIDRAILNYCIAYSIKKCENEVPPYSYYEKVMNTWLNANVETYQDVIDLTNSEETKQRKAKKKIKADEPEWLKEYKEHFEEGVEDL